MLIIPAIDLLDGKVVRLEQGDVRKTVVYSDRPARVARRFEKAGVKWIHAVDLDGAFGRFGVNNVVLEELVRSVSIPIELGGGIRTPDRIQHWLDSGIGRIVLGSAAVKDPALVAESVRRFGSEKIVVGIDLRDGRAAIHGWREETPIHYLDLARSMESAGVRRVIVTDIASDGMLAGPRLDAVVDIAESTHLSVIVSGGISGIEDIRKLDGKDIPGIEGVIVGKAVYEKKLDLQEAVRLVQDKPDA